MLQQATAFTENTRMVGYQRSEKPTTVIIAHQQRLMREGIASILSQSGFIVLEQVSTLPVLRQLIRQHSPNLLLMGWELLEGAYDIVNELAALSPQSVIVTLNDAQMPGDFAEAMQAGTRSLLSVNLSPEEFADSLRMAARGDVIVSREIKSQIAGKVAFGRRDGKSQGLLSEREREVLSLVGCGATNKEIAERLIITENTVKVHLRNILDKLDLRNRQQAAAFAAREGLIVDEE
jgi:DNA-binding NarL/FixJ family response regulator